MQEEVHQDRLDPISKINEERGVLLNNAVKCHLNSRSAEIAGGYLFHQNETDHSARI